LSDNAQDAIRNGVFHPPRGSAHGRAKLSEDIVREIRRLYATGEFTQQELALRFGVSKHTISLIVRRKIWKHVL
jgi:DNA invertase Pin-like site-specific DNA recombinase